MERRFDNTYYHILIYVHLVILLLFIGCSDSNASYNSQCRDPAAMLALLRLIFSRSPDVQRTGASSVLWQYIL